MTYEEADQAGCVLCDDFTASGRVIPSVGRVHFLTVKHLPIPLPEDIKRREVFASALGLYFGKPQTLVCLTLCDRRSMVDLS